MFIMVRLRKSPKDPRAGMSSIEWNRVVYDSFQAGWLKKLDFGLLVELRSHLSKRMYRFLDKHFYKKSRWVYDLENFASEKMAMSRNYSNWKRKDRLKPAIRELEQKGFLEPMPEDRRFRKVGPKKWTVCFARAGTRSCDTNSTRPAARVRQLEPALVLPVENPCGFPPEVVAYLDRLTPDEREKLEKKVVFGASSGVQGLLQNMKHGSKVYRLTLDRAVSEHVLLKLREAAA